MSTPASQLPFLPQQLPKSQADWQQSINILQQWQNALNGVINSGVSFTAPTLLNGWVNFAPGDSPAGFYVDQTKRVWLRGLLGSGTAGTVMFTLPANCVPRYYTVMGALAFSGAGGVGYSPSRVDVDQSGNVILTAFPTAFPGYFLSLEGLNFSTLQ